MPGINQFSLIFIKPRRRRNTLTQCRNLPPTTPSPGTLTGDQTVTYSPSVTDDDLVFKALADPTRRFLLDLLFSRDGRTLKELESGLDMTRFGVMKHLKVLEDAGLVVTRRSGREKLHFLNAVPIRMIHDRWIDKYREREVTALIALKAELEKKDKDT
jgi:DNA-binding transcriptional ArsR family regulator